MRYSIKRYAVPLVAAAAFAIPCPAYASSGQSLPGLCQAPQAPAKVVCEIGAGFLCVSTPPGGVSADYVTVEGTIDRISSVLAGVSIRAQNDYTKSISFVDTSNPAGSGCGPGSPADFCLDSEGRFSARVPLSEMGPHTISVLASRLSGETVERKVRVSRVVPPSFEKSDLSFDPDILTSQSVDVPHVRVSVELLPDCQFCDFIGAATGGVELEATNEIVDSGGNVKRVVCSTTVEQGGQGRFSIGVPVGAGANSLFIKVCNAASGASCPSFGPVSFTGSVSGEKVDAIEFLSPDPRPSYDSSEFPTLPWRFRIAGSDSCVDVRFNRLAPISLCPDGQGVYSLTLNPRRGVNLATISGESGIEEFAWTFGWGRILSPHASGGVMRVPSAVEAALPAGTASRIVLPLINNFLASDERDEFIDSLLSGIGGPDAGGGSDDDGVAALIPKCSSGDLGGFTARLRGSPSIGKASLKNLAFAGGRMDISASVNDVEIGMDLVPQKDLPPLPLVISFRKALLDVELISDMDAGSMPILLVSSPHSDCDYKAGSYCKRTPAALVPGNLVGGANSWGGFVSCDTDKASGKAKEACAAINSLNAQTGVINEKVLDAINMALYCGGSTALTRMARNGVELPSLTLGGRSRNSIMPYVSVPMALRLEKGIGISSGGILVDASLEIGSAKTYSSTPAAAKIPSAGVILGEGFGASSFAGAEQAGGDLGLSLALDSVNSLLFAASASGDGRRLKGALDFDVHEGFFRELGFDFVAECDAFQAQEGAEDRPTLCHIRPRVSEMLGSPLTTYGYFEGSRPVMAAVRGNRALGARIAAVEPYELPVISGGGEGGASGSYSPAGPLVSIELGGMEVSFYALKTDDSVPPDAYGNPALLMDGSGRPVIDSMRPDDPDPMNGQIISFDLTLLAAVELGWIEHDAESESGFVIPLRILADRTRLALTPIPGSNSTTVPAVSLVSQLAEKLALALSGFSGEEGVIRIPVPAEIAISAGDGGLFGTLGLASIDFGAGGVQFELDPYRNSVTAAVSAIITQILHVGGKEKIYTIQ